MIIWCWRRKCFYCNFVRAPEHFYISKFLTLIVRQGPIQVGSSVEISNISNFKLNTQCLLKINTILKIACVPSILVIIIYTHFQVISFSFITTVLFIFHQNLHLDKALHLLFYLLFYCYPCCKGGIRNDPSPVQIRVNREMLPNRWKLICNSCLIEIKFEKCK